MYVLWTHWLIRWHLKEAININFLIHETWFMGQVFSYSFIVPYFYCIQGWQNWRPPLDRKLVNRALLAKCFEGTFMLYPSTIWYILPPLLYNTVLIAQCVKISFHRKIDSSFGSYILSKPCQIFNKVCAFTLFFLQILIRILL